MMRIKNLILLLVLFNLPMGISTETVEALDPLTFEMQSNYTYINSVRKRTKNELVKEVNSCIKYYAPKSKISSTILVDKCLEYDVDIVLALSQGILESHMGTKGKAFKTNSVWNVGTLDDGRILYTYKHPNESIEPYLILLSRNYLANINTKGDTIRKDVYVLLNEGFKDMNDNRFATNKNYEKSLRIIMDNVNSASSISLHQSIMKLEDKKIIALFGPEDYYADLAF